MREFAVNALTDAHVEVRELASHSLSSLLRVVPADEAKKLTVRLAVYQSVIELTSGLLQSRFAKLAATPMPKTKGQLSPEENNARITRHAGVLGLIGLLHSQPYELPDVRIPYPLSLSVASSHDMCLTGGACSGWLTRCFCSHGMRTTPRRSIHLCAEPLLRFVTSVMLLSFASNTLTYMPSSSARTRTCGTSTRRSSRAMISTLLTSSSLRPVWLTRE